MSARLLAVAVLTAAVGALAPAAQAKELHANVVSLQSDLTPGEPVPLVFELSMWDGAAADTQPASVVFTPAVVLIGEHKTRRFPASDLGGGRYSAEIVFPSGGDWKLRVAVGDDPLVLLGKGAVRIDAPSPASPARLRELPLMLAGAALLAFLHFRTRSR